jgi:phosphate transport system substrate-binding protein
MRVPDVFRRNGVMVWVVSAVLAVAAVPMLVMGAVVIRDGERLLRQMLYIYVNKAPGRALDPVTREFLHLVLSKDGQALVAQDGYFPLAAAVVQEGLARIH